MRVLGADAHSRDPSSSKMSLLRPLVRDWVPGEGQKVVSLAAILSSEVGLDSHKSHMQAEESTCMGLAPAIAEGLCGPSWCL